MYGTFLETLMTKEYNATGFSVLDSPYRDQEAKEGLKKRFKGISRRLRILMGFSAIRMHVWYIFENLTDQGHNRTGFAILDSPYKDQEAKEGLKKRFFIFFLA